MKAHRIPGIWLVGLVLATAVAGSDGEPQKKSYKAIPIPAREHGYSNFDTTVIMSQNELDAFLKKASHAQGMGWNSRKEFVNAISQAGLDFSKEALVLLRHTEGSGSIQVEFGQTELKGTRLICEIKRTEPEIGTADMAFYCFALAVDKASVTEVELKTNGQEPILLSIKGGAESNKADAGESK